MYEVELKVEADHEAVRETLDSLDAQSLDRVTQSDTYYDAPHREFAETDEALRIRRETPVNGDSSRVEMTYKGPKIDPGSKARTEVETGVDSGDAAASIVRSLGFEPAAVVTKERDRYRLDGFTVTLDSVEDVGDFVEVETETDFTDIDRAREGAKVVLENLGLDPDEQIRTSYLGLRLDDAAQ